MVEQNKDYDELKKIIRSLLLSSKHGLTVNELCSEYNVITSKVLPYKALGYSSAVDLVKDMPDVVQPIFHRNGNMLLRGIADEHTAHIKALVHGQKEMVSGSKLYSAQQMLTSSTKRSVSSFVQSKIYSVVKDYPNGIDIATFEQEYIRMYGKKINPLLQGFTSIRLLLESCSDIIRVNSKEGKVSIYPLHEDDETTTAVVESKLPSRHSISIELRKEIFAVLMKFNHNRGLFSSHFLTEYKNIHKKNIDILSLGYGSVIELMSKFSDMIDIERPVSDGDWLLIPKSLIIDEDGIVVKTNYQYMMVPPVQLNQLVGIVLTYIINPSMFWFQFTDNLQCLYMLMSDMNEFYESCDRTMYVLPTHSIVVGQPCAAKYSDGKWYRGIIKNVHSNNKVDVFYVDFGDSLELDASCLLILRIDFVSLPSQAILGRLNVRCIGCNGWPQDIVKKFFLLTQDKRLAASITNHEKMAILDLFDSDCNNICEVITNELEQIKTELKGKSKPAIVLPLDEAEEKDEETPDEEEVEYMRIKCLRISDEYILHIINLANTPYITSAEASGLFWKGDVLKQMLRLKHLKITSDVLHKSDDIELFTILHRYNVSGLFDDRKVMKPSITIYKLSDLPDILSVFECFYENTFSLIVKEIEQYNVDTVGYWKKVEGMATVPEEEKEKSLNELQGLKSRRKKLFKMIMMNRAEENTLEEIQLIDKEIANFKL